MANPEHLEILKQGVEVWNKWREEKREIVPDLSESKLCDLAFNGIDLYGANLQKVDLRFATLLNANLSDADLRGAQLNMAVLFNANLQRVDLRGAILCGANLTGANLCNADLSGSDLFNTFLDAALLCQANFTGADLNRASLNAANLSRANLTRADLSEADLTEADLSKVDLRDAILSGADLSMANLTSANIKNCTFSDASFCGTILADINFNDACDLNSVWHLGPSTIGVDTIFKSNGKIPKSFLHNCDVPKHFIEQLFYTSEQLQFYSCFISYSSQDDDFAQKLYADLRGCNVRVYFAPEDLKIGDKILERLDQSIRIHDKLLLVLSEQSIKSDWVEDEVTTAFEEERRREDTVLFPICLDGTVMASKKAWASKVRQRHIGDFTDWKNHDSYQKAFDRLLRDLKASEE